MTRCDWCSSAARWRVTWPGTKLPALERAAVCDHCTPRPVAILAAINLVCYLAPLVGEMR